MATPKPTSTIPVPTRMKTADPSTIQLEGARPGLKWVSTQGAGSDNILSRPLGYRVKALTVVAPDSSYATGANSDSVYVDLEEVSFPAAATPTGLNGPVEIPPGKSWTFEEVDPGWYHFGSPTANQRLIVSYGGPSPTPPNSK